MSEAVAPPPQQALPAALAAVEAAIAQASAAPVWPLDTGEIGPSLQLVVSFENRLAALRLSLVQQAEERSLAESVHARTTAFRLAQLLKIDHLDAAAQVRLAKEGGQQVLTAIAEGSVCETKALAIVDGLRLIKQIGTVTTDEVAAGEEFLLEWAPHLTRKELKASAERIADVLDPDRGKKLDEDERLAHSLREITPTPDVATRGAMYRISGRLTKDTASLLMTALDAVMRTDPESSDEKDLPRAARRTPPQRRADALASLIRLGADHDDMPLRHGEPVQAMITTPMATLEQRTAEAGLVDPATRRPTSYLPGLTEHGDRLSPATLRRLACDAKLVPVVLGSRGQPLDLGREVRLATATINRASPSSSAAAAASAAPRHRPRPPPTTSTTGPMTDPPAWPTARRCAGTSTGSSTRAAGSSEEPQNPASSNGDHPPGSTPPAPGFDAKDCPADRKTP